MGQVSDEHHDQTSKQISLQYFLPGQMVFHITHQGEVSDDQIKKLMAWSNELAGGATISSPRVLRFPAASQPQPPKDQPPGEGINQAKVNPLSMLTLIFADVENTDNLKLVELIKRLNDRRKEQQPVAGLTLELLSPNWLMNGAIHIPGTGGPGAWPVEAHPPDGDRWKFELSNQQAAATQLSLTEGQGAGVHVAILDTAPPQHALDTAYAEWRWHHPLIESMLRPGGPLHVYPATYDDLHLTADFSLLEHPYLMRDHGLFVAGIIHTIAPKATLHLYEVLNPYGVGSIETIAQGLLRILGNADIKRPLIINCSFTLGVPGDGNFDSEAPVGLQNLDPAMSIKTLFDCWLADHDKVVVVAAAGNDADNSRPRPQARYPASFDNVVGVGALPKETNSTSPYPAATYSNLSDVPPMVGYMTLGGEPGPKQGVLGVYIGEFPHVGGCLSFLWRILGRARPGHLPSNPRSFTPNSITYQRNTTGWAWWAGTSFATPIISGILASWRSQPGNQARPFQFQEAQQALISLRQQQNGSAQAITTPEGENVILVEQK